MLDNFKRIEEFFRELDASLHGRVSLYLIGGAALMKRGLKTATKDIDLVVSERSEFVELQKAFAKLGFKTTLPGREYEKMNLTQIFERGDFRIDLFEKDVCGKFSLTEEMKKRAERVMGLDDVSVYVCSNEDIFLFKTMTEREGDIEDCITIATSQILDWNIVLKELENQIRGSGRDVWVTWVAERLDTLIARGVDVPLMVEFDKLRKEFFVALERRRESLMGLHQGNL